MWLLLDFHYSDFLMERTLVLQTVASIFAATNLDVFLWAMSREEEDLSGLSEYSAPSPPGLVSCLQLIKVSHNFERAGNARDIRCSL